jgi:hypothetical protein
MYSQGFYIHCTVAVQSLYSGCKNPGCTFTVLWLYSGHPLHSSCTAAVHGDIVVGHLDLWQSSIHSHLCYFGTNQMMIEYFCQRKIGLRSHTYTCTIARCFICCVFQVKCTCCLLALTTPLPLLHNASRCPFPSPPRSYTYPPLHSPPLHHAPFPLERFGLDQEAWRANTYSPKSFPIRSTQFTTILSIWLIMNDILNMTIDILPCRNLFR